MITYLLNIFNKLIVYYIRNLKNVYNTGKEILFMQITDIKIRKFFDEGPMKAIASVTLDNCLAIHDIKVIYARERFFIVMPSRKNPDGTYRDIAHPINSRFRGMLEEAVIDAYHVQLVAAEHDAELAEESVIV